MENKAVEHKIVSIYDLVPHERNYNKHSQEQIEKLKASLRRFSQVDDAIVKVLPGGKYKIVAHEGVTTAALQLLKGGECPHLAQWGITIVPEHWTDTDVLGYMVASNETARLSAPDDEALAALLQEQQDAGFDLASLGTDDETLRQMLESLGDDVLASNSRTTELNEPEGGDVQSSYNILIECGTEEDQQRAYDLVIKEGFTCKVLTL